MFGIEIKIDPAVKAVDERNAAGLAPVCPAAHLLPVAVGLRNGLPLLPLDADWRAIPDAHDGWALVSSSGTRLGGSLQVVVPLRQIAQGTHAIFGVNYLPRFVPS